MDIKFKAIGYTNVFRGNSRREVEFVQRTVRSADNHHARIEPIKVYGTEAKARSYTLPGYEPAEVFVKDAA